jgi:hypothetical protein
LEQFLEPLGIGLQVWHDATPIHYDYITRTSKLGFIQERERVLARQHRYVIKDKLPYYDFVLAFEVRIHHLLTPCDPSVRLSIGCLLHDQTFCILPSRILTFTSHV